MKPHLLLLATILFTSIVYAASPVDDVNTSANPETGVTLVGGTITLPSAGQWSIAQTQTGPVVELALQAPELLRLRSQGQRALQRQERKLRNSGQYLLQSFYRAIKTYAEQHDGWSPHTLAAIKDTNFINKAKLDDYFLLPPRQILSKDGKRWKPVKNTQPLLLELKPSIDDGKYWVLLSNGRSKLQAIDQQLVSQYQLHIEAQNKPIAERLKQIRENADYTVVGRLRGPLPRQALTLQLKNTETGEQITRHWQPEQVNSEDESLRKLWARQRLRSWTAGIETADTGYLGQWLAAGLRQYDLNTSDILPQASRSRRNNRNGNLFAALSGQAAIEETLQLQALGNSEAGISTIPIDTLAGVNVKSHPFEQMLGDSAGGRLSIADLVPADRFFAWFSEPAALTGYLENGSDFIFNSMAVLQGKVEDHALYKRYLQRLGISRAWARRFLDSGAVTQLAVVLPDLFLTEGTDISLILQLKNPEAATLLLKLLGIDIQGRPFEFSHVHGKSYWAMQQNHLLISTHLGELQRILHLAAQQGADSLGQSAEFKYMLTQLPVTDNSRAFFYFSDPFIRRLLSPAVKIGQQRRKQARAELLAANAARRLYYFDHGKPPASLDELITKAYLPAPSLVTDMELNKAGFYVSKTWGSAARMPTLLQRPVTQVSATEKHYYERYLRRYNRYWSRFFDPIAVRLNQQGTQQMQVSTFILPLIDNSLYNGLKTILHIGSDDTTLSVPRLQPKPVFQLSLNLNPLLLQQGIGLTQDFLIKYIGIPARIFDFIGPDLHIALADSDPVVVMGSGNIGGLLGMLDGGGRANEMLSFSMLGSLLTRPVVLILGLSDPAAVKNLLHNMPTGPSHNISLAGLGSGTLYGVANKDAWRYDIHFGQFISMRFGLEIKDRYLLISNQPLSYNPKLTGSTPQPGNAAALKLNPAAAVRQRPALFASAAEQQRKAAMQGIRTLLPFLLSGADSVQQAQAQAAAELGFTPKHPAPGKWEWNHGLLRSSVFGDLQHQLQPDHVPEKAAFGLLRQIDQVHLNMQFEADGLRATAEWTLAE